MKEVLFLFNGNLSGLSGGDQHAIQLANYMSNNKYSVDAVLPKNTYELFLDKKIRKIIYSKFRFESKYYKYSLFLFAIYLIRSAISIYKTYGRKYDIAISASHLFYDSIVSLFTHSGIKVFYIYHILSDQNRNEKISLLKKLLEKLVFVLINKPGHIIFADNLSVKQSLINKYKFNKNVIFLTKNGIDLKLINKIKVLEKKYDLVFCGRLHQTKGINDLMQIIIKLKKVKRNIKCVIIGDGHEKQNIESFIRRNDLTNNVILTGFVNETTKIKLFKSSKVFVLPSHEEGWGIVIGEALACRLPVVTYDLEEIKSIWKNMVSYIPRFDINKFSDIVKKKLIRLKNNTNSNRKINVFIESLNWEPILKEDMRQIRTK